MDSNDGEMVNLQDYNPESIVTMMDPSNFENVVNNEVIIEDEGEPMTFLQLDCESGGNIFTFESPNVGNQMQPQSSSTPIQNAERNSDNPVNDQADERETIVDDPTGRIPPWAFSLQNVQETTFGQETNSGEWNSSNPAPEPSENILAGVRTTVFRKRMLVPFPGTRLYPLIDNYRPGVPVTYTREASQLETGTATRLPSASIVVESSQDFRSGPGISMPMDAGTSHTANGIIITSSYSQDAGLAGPGHGTPGVAISASSSGFISNQTFRASCDPSLTPTSCINNEAYDSCLNSTGGNSCINSKTDISKIFGSNSYGEIMPPTAMTGVQVGYYNNNNVYTNVAHLSNIVQSAMFKGQNVVDPSLVSPPNNFSSFDGSRRDVVAKDPFSPGKHGFDMSNSRKKKRIIFSDSQYAFMKEAFDANPYLPRNERRKVAKTLDLSEDSVNIWFRNYRSKLKRKQQQQLEDSRLNDQAGDAIDV